MDEKTLDIMLKSGISPLQMLYSPIKSCTGNQNFGWRSFLQVNSLDLGSLLPEQYQEVASRNTLGTRLDKWSLNKLFQDIILLEGNANRYQFVTTRMSSRMLLSGNAKLSIERAIRKYDFKYIDKVCIEFPSDILFYETKEVVEKLKELKELGVKVACGEFGDDFCPVNRIKPLPFDIVFIDKSIGFSFVNQEPSADSLIKYCAELGFMTVLCANLNSDETTRAFYLNCSAYNTLHLSKLSQVAKIGGDA